MTGPSGRRALATVFQRAESLTGRQVALYGHLVPEASGRARDALDKAFGLAGMCPQSAPGTS